LEDERPLSWLYDYSLQEAWLDHPVKRFKSMNITNPPINRSNTLYPPMNSQTLPCQVAPKLEIKQEPIAAVSIIASRRNWSKMNLVSSIMLHKTFEEFKNSPC
jgi:mediator of RNA polymerase II transcription subunit 13